MYLIYIANYAIMYIIHCAGIFFYVSLQNRIELFAHNTRSYLHILTRSKHTWGVSICFFFQLKPNKKWHRIPVLRDASERLLKCILYIYIVYSVGYAYCCTFAGI